jgi:alditol oxidase
MIGKNWAGNYAYRAARLHEPATVDDVQELVKRSARLKVLGSRHSFNDIADCPDGDLISLTHLNAISIDRERRTVTVGGGVRYGELCEYLNQEGYALRNLASLPHISVAGACATATHGSGDGNGNLATAVSEIELVTAAGDVAVLSRERDAGQFPGAVVALGGLGVVTNLTLDILPAFDVRQDVYENLPFAAVEEHFDEIMSAAYSVSLFTDWQGAKFNKAWLKSRVASGAAFTMPSDFFGAKLAAVPEHPLEAADPGNCTEQGGKPGPWHERLPHFRFGFQPSHGDELQSEYFVPREHAVEALREIFGLGDRMSNVLWISEIRTIDADSLWMSPCYGRKSVAIHFTWQDKWTEVQRLLPVIEERLAPFDVRPHWGKLFTMDARRLQALYERLPDFRRLLAHYDPRGKFRNPYLEQHIL